MGANLVLLLQLTFAQRILDPPQPSLHVFFFLGKARREARYSSETEMFNGPTSCLAFLNFNK